MQSKPVYTQPQTIKIKRSNNQPLKPFRCNHSCILSILKTTIHCGYYGFKLRFIYTLIYNIVYRKVPFKHILATSFQKAIHNLKFLASFGFIFKASNCLINRSQKLFFRKITNRLNLFVSAFVGSLYVSGQRDSVRQQTFYYLFGRSIIGSIDFSMKHNYIPTFKYWSTLVSLVWGLLVFYFEVNKQNLNISLVKSLKFLLIDSDNKDHNLQNIETIRKILVL